MNDQRMTVIVDLTSPLAAVWALSPDADTPGMRFTLPCALEIQRQPDGGLRVGTVDKENDQLVDDHAISFRDLSYELPRIQDSSVRAFLLQSFLHQVSHEMVARGFIQADDTASAYLIIPHLFSLPDLDALRMACQQPPLKVFGFFQEALAVSVGFLRSDFSVPLNSELRTSGPVTVCLIMAVDETKFEVACLNCSFEQPNVYHIEIRDFLKTGCDDLSLRLRDCDWLGSFSRLVLITPRDLPAQAKSTLTSLAEAISDDIAPEWHVGTNISEIKLGGAAYIAGCAAKESSEDLKYLVTHACHIGVQVTNDDFNPIFNKRDVRRLKEFPAIAVNGFRLRGPKEALRLNVYAGYSTRIDEAALIAQVTVSPEEQSQLSSEETLTTVVQLDAPGRGEFSVGSMPANRVWRRAKFCLAGLVT